MTKDGIHYKVPQVDDAESISECIKAASSTSVVGVGTGEDIIDWSDVSGPHAIARRIRNGDRALMAVGPVDGQVDDTIDGQMHVVGFIAYRDIQHLSLLFVRQSHQRYGIGKALIEQTIETLDKVTVNSTDSAVGFYQRIGFSVSGERMLKRGAWSTPMIWRRSQGVSR